ncbi:restriction endonuclease subunit S [Aeromonas caviae]
MSDMHEISLRSFFSHSITGEWGSEPIGNKDVTVFRAADFTKDCKLRRDGGVLRAIPPSKLNVRRLENNDILIEKSGGSPDQPVGRAVLFEPQDEDQVAACSNFIQRMVVKKCYEPLFVYYLLLFLYEQNATLPYQQQTTGIINLKLDEYLELQVKTYLDRTVQTQISSILKSVDQQIALTLSQIEKMTLLKQGMMADLFSRGIDPMTGKLRPSVHDAPELYNDSPLGPVPKAWSVELLKERLNGHGFIQTGPFGSQLHAYDYVDSGVPVVMPQDLLDGEISTDKISYISPDKAETLSRHKLASNDVIFSRRGDLTRSAFVDSDNGYQGFLCGTGCLLMRVKPEVLCAGWFSNLYGTRLVQAQVDGLAVGTTMANLNSSILGKLLLPFPSVSEQQQIHKRLQAVNSPLKVYISELRKLRAQKAGLMRDLLTGKVPVSA